MPILTSASGVPINLHSKTRITARRRENNLTIIFLYSHGTIWVKETPEEIIALGFKCNVVKEKK